MQVTVLAGGVGGSRFLRGVRALLGQPSVGSGQPPAPESRDGSTAGLTAVVNTADDITLYGLRVCPDLDTVMYTLGGGSDEERGWGRSDETFHARDELVAYGAEPQWFGLGDRDLATHLVRTQLLAAGYPLSDVTAALCARWPTGLRLLPMTDERVETHIVVADAEAPGGRRAMHFQEYWVRWHAKPMATEVAFVGIDEATPAPGVLPALHDADLVILAPSNPVVSIGPILAVDGIVAALRERIGPVVGVSPIIGGRPVRGMADRLLPAIGVDTDAGAVGLHYGSRHRDGVLDAWLVDVADAAAVSGLLAAGIRCEARPLVMSDVGATAEIARAAGALVGVELS